MKNPETANADTTTRADLPSLSLPNWALLYGLVAPYGLPSLELVAYSDQIKKDIAHLCDALGAVQFSGVPLDKQNPIKQLMKDIAHGLKHINRIADTICEHHAETDRYLWKLYRHRTDYGHEPKGKAPH